VDGLTFKHKNRNECVYMINSVVLDEHEKITTLINLLLEKGVLSNKEIKDAFEWALIRKKERINEELKNDPGLLG
jgi:predicted transcriptional regulator